MKAEMSRGWVFKSIGILLFSLANILIIDLVTNSVTEIQGAAWDFNHYIDMAENGIRNNPNLLAPFAYRPLTPLLAGWLMKIFQFSSWKAFKLIAYLGAALNLLTLYWLLDKIGYRFKDILIVLEIISLQFYQIKFLMFDPFRPDHLVFPLINLAYLALMADLPVLLAAFFSLGMLVREFIVLPLAVYLADFIKSKGSNFIKPLTILSITTAVFVGIRRFIPVQASEAYFEINSADRFIKSLNNVLMDWKRNINILLCLSGYVLPLLMVFTPSRLKNAWKELGDYRLWLVVHAGCTLVLVMIGGTDVGRFIVYLYLPAAVLLAAMLKNERISLVELLLVLMGAVIFNRMLWKVPTASFDAYLDFYGGYGSRINLQTGLRFFEISGWIIICRVYRQLISAKIPRKKYN